MFCTCFAKNLIILGATKGKVQATRLWGKGHREKYNFINAQCDVDCVIIKRHSCKGNFGEYVSM